MDADRAVPRLLAISDAATRGSESLAAWVERLAAAGVDAVRIRERHLDDAAMLAAVREAIAVAAGRLRVLASDRADVALAAGADGVHLPSDGVPATAVRQAFPALTLVGCSTHSAAGVEALAGVASYAVLGPVWATPSHPGRAGIGLAALAAATRHGVRVLALGGVDDPQRVRAALAAGAHGVAGIRLFHREDLGEVIAAAGLAGAATPAAAARS